MEIRPAIKEMKTIPDLILLLQLVWDSKDESDIEFRNEIDAELKVREISNGN